MRIVKSNSVPNTFHEEPVIYLSLDGWNDWWEYQCLHMVFYCFEDKNENLGSIKIGEKGLMLDDNIVLAPDIPEDCPKLPSQFYSLGQGVTYYNNLACRTAS
jgi:hypothetical protein